jgi:hypothetical protein
MNWLTPLAHEVDAQMIVPGLMRSKLEFDELIARRALICASETKDRL